MYKIQIGLGNCVHIRMFSHLWGIHNERFHCHFKWVAPKIGFELSEVIYRVILVKCVQG